MKEESNNKKSHAPIDQIKDKTTMTTTSKNQYLFVKERKQRREKSGTGATTMKPFA